MASDPIVGGAIDSDGDQILADEQRAREELVALCMAQEGFEYIAWVPKSVGASLFAEDAEPFSREWVERIGFGITTSAFAQSRVGPTLVGFDDRSILESVQKNPNDKIVASMGDSEAEAYFEALLGNPDIDVSIEDDEESEAGFQIPDGCVGAALRDPTANAGTRFRVEFASEIEGLLLRVAADPRILEFENELAECVEGEGFEFLSYQQLVAGESPWEEALLQLRPEASDPLGEIDPEELEAMSDQDLAELGDTQAANLSLGAELSADAKTVLGALQTEERELAVAVYDCGGLGTEEADLRALVLRDVEERFIEDNGDRLREFNNG